MKEKDLFQLGEILGTPSLFNREDDKQAFRAARLLLPLKSKPELEFVWGRGDKLINHNPAIAFPSMESARKVIFLYKSGKGGYSTALICVDGKKKYFLKPIPPDVRLRYMSVNEMVTCAYDFLSGKVNESLMILPRNPTKIWL